jgi:hypothetical protein
VRKAFRESSRFCCKTGVKSARDNVKLTLFMVNVLINVRMYYTIEDLGLDAV